MRRMSGTGGDRAAAGNNVAGPRQKMAIETNRHQSEE